MMSGTSPLFLGIGATGRHSINAGDLPVGALMKKELSTTFLAVE
jgi:hypothetical protein